MGVYREVMLSLISKSLMHDIIVPKKHLLFLCLKRVLFLSA